MRGSTYTYEVSFHRANVIVAACNELDLEQLKALLEHARNVLKIARSAAEFAKGRGILSSAIEKFDTALKKIDQALRTGKRLFGDAEAACQIIEAMDVLMRWQPNSTSVSRDEAARAFDKLFAGVAHYFAKLPAPFDSYAKLLQELADQNFFEVVSRYGDPTQRPSGYDQWDHIEDQGGALRR